MQVNSETSRIGGLLQDGCPVACSGDAPFGYANVFTSHVNVGFFHGTVMFDIDNLCHQIYDGPFRRNHLLPQIIYNHQTNGIAGSRH
jgi:hypothetical protein